MSSRPFDPMKAGPAVALPIAAGDRVRFVLTQPTGDGQTATQMEGDGYVMVTVGGGENPQAGAQVCFIAVLGYAGILSIPAAACETIERGALLRRLTLAGRENLVT